MLCAVYCAAEDAAAQDFGGIEQAPQFSRGFNVAVRERPHPEWAPLGIDLGSFQLSPQISLTSTFTDNEKDATTDTRSDESFRIQPALQIGSNWSQNGVGLQAYMAQTEYARDSEDDSTEFGFIGTGRLDVASDLGIDLRGDAQHLVLARSDPDVPVDSLGPAMFYREDLQATVTKTFPRFQLQGIAAVRREDYNTVGAPNGGTYDFSGRDGTYTSYSGRVSYGLSPAVAAFVGVLADQSFRPEIDNINFNAAGANLAGGVNFDLTRLARGEVAIGYLYQSYSTPNTPASSGLALSANLQYFPTELTTISLTAERANAPSSTTGSAGGITTDGSLTIDHELLRNFILTGGFQAGTTSYVTIDRHDKSYGGSLGGTYLMNRLISVDFSYAYRNYDSTGRDAKRSYDDNRLAFTVRLTR